jgi:hypothetical protein
MFSDAVDEGLADSNPFGRMGLKQTDGRKDLTVLTKDEVQRLADVAREAREHRADLRAGARSTSGARQATAPGR